MISLLKIFVVFSFWMIIGYFIIFTKTRTPKKFKKYEQRFESITYSILFVFLFFLNKEILFNTENFSILSYLFSSLLSSIVFVSLLLLKNWIIKDNNK